MNEFYLVKCYMKHTAISWNSFLQIVTVFSHISIFSPFPWKCQITHISSIYVQIDDMMSQVLYVQDLRSLSK